MMNHSLLAAVESVFVTVLFGFVLNFGSVEYRYHYCHCYLTTQNETKFEMQK